MTILAVTLMWFSFTAAFASNASAQECVYSTTEHWYFTDSTKTELCGYLNNCTDEWWGSFTQYREVQVIQCPCN
jgi:hypothetical protein